MTSDRMSRVYTLFCAGREMDSAQRQSFLEKECAGDDRLLQEILEMLQLADESGGVLSNPPWKRHFRGHRVFEADQVIEDRYRIVRFIGVGGMGEVYEATDGKFNTSVAVKTIRPEIAGDKQAVARFLREVQLQREVSHENVCRLFDIHHHQVSGEEGISFLTMQYLGGETLAATLKRDGAMTSSKAAPLALQIAAGLAAAHRANILHRDLKSANVILCPRPDRSVKAVITDFGLARHIEPTIEEATLTRTGEPLGTLDYMAPELLAGERASTASEIYAFGTILYEMVAGERPFAKHSSSVAAYKRAQGPPPIREKVPDLDRHWQDVITACLDVDPCRRPTLEQVVVALGGSSTPFGSGFSVSVIPSTSDSGQRIAGWLSRRRRASMLALLGFFLLVSLSLVGSRYYGRPSDITAGAYIFVSEMTNATGDADLDIACELLRIQLRQSGYLRLVDDGDAARARTAMAIAGSKVSDPKISREIAFRTTASLVVSGTLIRKGNGFSLFVQMERLGDSPVSIRKLWSHEFPASSKTQIFVSVKDAADWIRNTIGEGGNEVSERSVAPEEASSSSWEALRLFRDAEQLRKNRAKDVSAARADDAAIGKLQQALDLDPGFALAHVRLADILLARKEQKSAIAHLLKAVDASTSRRLTKWEELRARGTLAMAVGQYRTAEGLYNELIALYPAEYVPVTGLGSALQKQGRLDEALKWHQEAQKKDPTASAPVVGALGVFIFQDRLDDAEASIQRLAQMGAGALSSERLGIVRFLKGDSSAARKLFEHSIESPSPTIRSSGYSLLASMLVETGQYTEAIATLEKGIRQDEMDGLAGQKAFKLLASASIFLRRYDFQKASAQCEDALRLVEHLDVCRRAATMLARMGRVKKAEEVLENLGANWKGPLADAARHQIRAEILLERRAFTDAMREFQEADRLDPIGLNREYLARAYAVSKDWDRASSIYESALERRGTFWQYQDSDLPGIRSSMLLDFAQVCRKSGRRDRLEAALREYSKIRPHADSGLPETLRAIQLAGTLPSLSQ